VLSGVLDVRVSKSVIRIRLSRDHAGQRNDQDSIDVDVTRPLAVATISGVRNEGHEFCCACLLRLSTCCGGLADSSSRR
jgi:hypothetical protein